MNSPTLESFAAHPLARRPSPHSVARCPIIAPLHYVLSALSLASLLLLSPYSLPAAASLRPPPQSAPSAGGPGDRSPARPLASRPAPRPQGGSTALLTAVQAGRMEVVGRLIDARAALDIQDKVGSPPLPSPNPPIPPHPLASCPAVVPAHTGISPFFLWPQRVAGLPSSAVSPPPPACAHPIR